MTDTPRTDQEEYFTEDFNEFVVDSDFARDLERELCDAIKGAPAYLIAQCTSERSMRHIAEGKLAVSECRVDELAQLNQILSDALIELKNSCSAPSWAMTMAINAISVGKKIGEHYGKPDK